MSITPIFYQSWDTELPNVIFNKNKKCIPDSFSYKRFSIKDIVEYLTEKWPHVLNKFNSYEIIQHKIDLWRYCILYDTGGIYMDVDCILMDDIKCLLDSDCFFVSNTRGNTDIFNGFLGTYPNNPLYLEIIQYMLGTDNTEYFFNCKELYTIINKYVCITQNVFDYTWNTKKISILWDIQKQDSRFYPYYYNKCILVETNPFYPYVMKGEIINIYKIINNIPTNVIQYPNEWNVIYETSDEYMLKNSKYTNIVVNNICKNNVIRIN
jgi:hypothetical protein